MTPREPDDPGRRRSWAELSGAEDLHPDVQAELRELVLAQGANEDEAAVLLLVIEQLKELQQTLGVAAAVDAARRVREIWLEH